MPFTLSQLVIAALVVATVLGLFLMARRKRGAKAAALEMAAAEPAPPEPVRRRQLQSFVDTEWDTAPEPLPELVPTPVPEPAAEPVAPPRLTEPAAFETDPVLAAPPPPPIAYEVARPEEDEADYDQAVLGRLEEAFEALQAGALSLEAYRARIVAEAAEVDQRIAVLERQGDGPALQAALVAQESVRWCLDWASDQGDRGDD